MRDKWEKGDPVNLSDLLKITPVANEIVRLGQELNMKYSDIMWIVTEIIRDYDWEGDSGISMSSTDQESDLDLELDLDDLEMFDGEWEAEEDERDPYYKVSLRVSSRGKFPEISFKAGINEREDLKGFLTLVLDIMGKMDI
ncbi:MAG: hypothetical protein GXY50_04650 [Syntrophomonadaceae bacterium]|nr:hypothetical protein [Syntrophomonadaceae bacterium]